MLILLSRPGMEARRLVNLEQRNSRKVPCSAFPVSNLLIIQFVKMNIALGGKQPHYESILIAIFNLTFFCIIFLLPFTYIYIYKYIIIYVMCTASTNELTRRDLKQ